MNETFLTERLPLAIYLHASGRLRFSHCESLDAGKVKFVFHDATAQGDQAELEFENGAVVQAKAIFASQTFLRRKMSEAQGENRRTYANYSR